MDHGTLTDNNGGKADFEIYCNHDNKYWAQDMVEQVWDSSLRSFE